LPKGIAFENTSNQQVASRMEMAFKDIKINSIFLCLIEATGLQKIKSSHNCHMVATQLAKGSHHVAIGTI